MERVKSSTLIPRQDKANEGYKYRPRVPTTIIHVCRVAGGEQRTIPRFGAETSENRALIALP